MSASKPIDDYALIGDGHLPGWNGAQPVRVGNAAAGQRQLDVYGEVLDSARLCQKAGITRSDKGRVTEKRLVEQVERIWQEPDQGMWESRAAPQHYVYSPLILRAIAAAKKRGLEVEAILDKSQDRRDSPRSRYTGATYLTNAGVPVWIDDAPAIVHSKVIVLDDEVVITGSFNFTKSADTRNAENVVFIDNRDVAAQFIRNWKERRSASRRFEPE